MITNKNTLRRRLQQNRQSEDRVRLMDIDKAINKEINDIKNQKWQELLKEINPQDNSVWRISNRFKKPFSQLLALKHDYRTGKKKEEAFGELFQGSFVKRQLDSRKLQK